MQLPSSISGRGIWTTRKEDVQRRLRGCRDGSSGFMHWRAEEEEEQVLRMDAINGTDCDRPTLLRTPNTKFLPWAATPLPLLHVGISRTGPVSTTTLLFQSEP